MKYGIGIQGSKNRLAEKIISVLPRATHFYDLFVGGGAVSHCALLSGKWKHIHFSDISDTVYCVKDMFDGNTPDGSEWISREDFFARKDKEPWVRLIWSFAGNQRDYLYSREIEPYKKAVHEMIYAETPNERRLKFKEVCRLMRKLNLGRIEALQHAERYKALKDNKFSPPPPIQLQPNKSYQRVFPDSKSRNVFTHCQIQWVPF